MEERQKLLDAIERTARLRDKIAKPKPEERPPQSEPRQEQTEELAPTEQERQS